MCVNFLDSLTLEGVSNGVGFWVKRSSVRWSTILGGIGIGIANIRMMGVFIIDAHIVC